VNRYTLSSRSHVFVASAEKHSFNDGAPFDMLNIEAAEDAAWRYERTRGLVQGMSYE
jgi:hypothetical protein